jgi:hypothetical protein
MSKQLQQKEQSQNSRKSGLDKNHRDLSQPLRAEHPILALQRTIGNQAVLRLLKSQSQSAVPKLLPVATHSSKQSTNQSEVVIQRQEVAEPDESHRRPGLPLPYREEMEARAREVISGNDQPRQQRPRTEAGMTGAHRGQFYTVYNDMVRVGDARSRSWRNQNPGNLRYRSSAAARHVGAISIDRDGFAIFPSEEIGWNVLVGFLTTAANSGRTIQSVMTQYAPPYENDLSAYLNFIRRQTGLNPTSRLLIDQVENVARAIRTYEGWHPGQIYSCDIAEAPGWVRLLLGC